MIEYLCDAFNIDGELRAAAVEAYERVRGISYDAQARNKATMLRIFADEGVAESDLAGATGYGYDDAARERYESLIARIFGCEAALARLSIVSGTHAIMTALAACTAPGETIVSLTGRPYDTLRNAICEAPHSLVSQGVLYAEVPLAGDRINTQAVLQTIEPLKAPTLFVQRSRGYATRPALPIDALRDAFEAIRAVRSDAKILVDNCYGELVEAREPTHVGADLVMGSLIKNLGGGLAPAGGYIAGRADLLERVTARLYAPGLRGGLGPTLGFGRALIQGLFVAPLVVEQTLRGLDFAAALFSRLGYDVAPRAGELRSDIVQAIRLGSRGALLRFSQGLQAAMPLNAAFRPEPGPVPGYVDPVIMSGGAFVGGATIELSCDAPLREPYEVYLQGGIVAEHTYAGSLLAARALRA